MHDLPACCRRKKYVVETAKMLPKMLEPIFIDPTIVQGPILRRVKDVVNPSKWQMYCL